MKRQVVLNLDDIRAAVEVYLVSTKVVASRAQVGSVWIRSQGSIETSYQITAEYTDDKPAPVAAVEPPKPPATVWDRVGEDDPE